MLRLKITSQAENIRLVEQFIDDVKDKLEFDEEIYGNIMIAVTESVNNAMIHGNKQDSSKYVDVSMEQQGHQICFTISDEGNGFDYDSLPDPTLPENLLNPGGRGIFLMRQLADDVKFLANGKMIQLIFDSNGRAD
jgi:serine/threonine-protein kinase RsbW